jgi:hypothetical protein
MKGCPVFSQTSIIHNFSITFTLAFCSTHPGFRDSLWYWPYPACPGTPGVTSYTTYYFDIYSMSTFNFCTLVCHRVSVFGGIPLLPPVLTFPSCCWIHIDVLFGSRRNFNSLFCSDPPIRLPGVQMCLFGSWGRVFSQEPLPSGEFHRFFGVSSLLMCHIPGRLG